MMRAFTTLIRPRFSTLDALTVIIYALSFTLGALTAQLVRPKLVNILTNQLTLQIFRLDTRIGSTGRV
jgi:hypothetical protein